MTPPTRVFVDSSVLIAAALSDRGSARDLLLGRSEREFMLFMSSLVIDETYRNLHRKAQPAAVHLRNLLETLAITIVDPSNALVIRCVELVHPKDAPIVAAAIAASADVLASYDRKHLLAQGPAIQRAFDIAVVTPNDLLGSSTISG